MKSNGKLRSRFLVALSVSAVVLAVCYMGIRLMKPGDRSKQGDTTEKSVRPPLKHSSRFKQGDILENSIGMTLVYIPPGEFDMGTPWEGNNWSPTEKPAHRVRITKGFLMGQTEVTQGQFKAVMDAQPWSGKMWVQESDNSPASHISWDDAVQFCEKLSQMDEREYRLPTEAEWEYACRAGSNTMYCFGDNPYGESPSALHEYAWFNDNTAKANEKYPHPVGLKKPNSFGLHDMHGNVWEWCKDYYSDRFYEKTRYMNRHRPGAAGDDPENKIANEQQYRVLRGGHWSSHWGACRSANRKRGRQDRRMTDWASLGFRVVALVTDLDSEE